MTDAKIGEAEIERERRVRESFSRALGPSAAPEIRTVEHTAEQEIERLQREDARKAAGVRLDAARADLRARAQETSRSTYKRLVHNMTLRIEVIEDLGNATVRNSQIAAIRQTEDGDFSLVIVLISGTEILWRPLEMDALARLKLEDFLEKPVTPKVAGSFNGPWDPSEDETD